MNLQAPYFDLYYQPGDYPVFCYRSGLLTYEERFNRGILTACGCNGAGYPQNAQATRPTRLDVGVFTEPSSFNLEIDGQSIDYALTMTDLQTERNETGLHVILTLESTLKPVRLKVHTLLDGTQMLTRYLEIENLSEQPLAVSRMVVLGGGLESMERQVLTNSNDINDFYSLGYFNNDVWNREGELGWHTLTPEGTVIDCRFGRDRFRHPVLFIRNNVLGRLYFMQTAWSGGCRFAVDYNAHVERNLSHLSFKAEITAHNPLLVIRPGETVTTPEVHFGMTENGFDDAINEMHDHIRRSVLNAPETDPSACYVGAGHGADCDMTVETSKAVMRQFAEMGAEIFIIDAGWECPPGKEADWYPHNGKNVPDADRYPNGIRELSDYCHSLGMKFGLWVEIERLGNLSSAFAAHPEWRASDIFGNQCGGFLDLTVPEAAAWAEEELARIIEDYQLELLRVDYNVSVANYFNMRDLGTGRTECVSVRHFKAVDKLYGNLKRRFPHVIFENCAGGGGRTDLFQMKNFHHTWVTDWQRAPRSIMITNGLTMVLPPERVDRLFAGQKGHIYGSLDTQMRNTMLTHMTLNVISPALEAPGNPRQMEFVRHSVALYKDFIRPFLPTCKTFHHTPDVAASLDRGYSALEIAAPDGSRGAMAAFALTLASENTYRLFPRGADPAKTYRVTLDNIRSTFTVNGYELVNGGIRVTLPASLTSELVLYEAMN